MFSTLSKREKQEKTVGRCVYVCVVYVCVLSVYRSGPARAVRFRCRRELVENDVIAFRGWEKKHSHKTGLVLYDEQ